MNPTAVINRELQAMRWPGLGRLAAGCPVVDLAANHCFLGGQDVACNLIRECDALTGAQHFEYDLPGASPNVNIWELQGDDSFIYNNPTAPPPTPPPTLTFRDTINPYDDPTFYKAGTPAAPTPAAPAPQPAAPAPQPAAPAPLNPRLTSIPGSPLSNADPFAAFRPAPTRQAPLPGGGGGQTVLLFGSAPGAPATTSTGSSSTSTTRTNGTTTTPGPIDVAEGGASAGLLLSLRDGATQAYESLDSLVPDVPGWALLAAAGGVLYLATKKR